jgi:hypothetical protein
VEFNLNPRDFEEFFIHPVWLWLKSELEVIRKNVRDRMEEEKKPNELFRCQGRAQAIRDILLMPENAKKVIEEDLCQKR